MKPSAIKPHDLAKSGGSGSVFLDIFGELAVEVRFGHFEIVQTSRSIIINDISNSVAHFSPRNDFSEEMILAEK